MSATTAVQTDKQRSFVRFITRSYAQLVFVAFALVPAYLIGYLYFFQNPGLKFENYPFHEIAITGATFVGLFVAYLVVAMLSILRRAVAAMDDARLPRICIDLCAPWRIHQIRSSKHLAIPVVWSGVASNDVDSVVDWASVVSKAV
ncbi:hypothetical protein QFZ99_007854 [Paraburkholderia atlantica]